MPKKKATKPAKTAKPTGPDYIEESLWPLVTDISNLMLDPENERKHPERNLEAIKASLARYRQQKPVVVDKNGIVLAGNGTLDAARSLGWTEIAAVRTTLDGSERTGYRIADNKTGELAEWDYEALAKSFEGLQLDDFQLEDTGFADFEWEPLLAGDWTPPPPPNDGGNSGGEGTGVNIRLSPEMKNRFLAVVDSMATKQGAKVSYEEAVMSMVGLWETHGGATDPDLPEV
jgi:hypothetical protein